MCSLGWGIGRYPTPDCTPDCTFTGPHLFKAPLFGFYFSYYFIQPAARISYQDSRFWCYFQSKRNSIIYIFIFTTYPVIRRFAPNNRRCVGGHLIDTVNEAPNGFTRRVKPVCRPAILNLRAISWLFPFILTTLPQ
jgi:hypothetical protein